MGFIGFFAARWQTILQLTVEHLVIVLVAMVISVVLGVAIGVLITLDRNVARVVLNCNNVLMTIPSLALFSLLIPVLGLGKGPAIVGLVAYTQLPLVRNVHTGITMIDPAVIEAARGMGLTERKIMFKIKIPLAFPAVMAGIRTATVMGIGIGAIAGYIGAGGLGVYIFQGISRSNDSMVVIGALVISLISVLTDRGLGRIQRAFDR
jgi:osmoprotectant transport system permease protein